MLRNIKRGSNNKYISITVFNFFIEDDYRQLINILRYKENTNYFIIIPESHYFFTTFHIITNERVCGEFNNDVITDDKIVDLLMKNDKLYCHF